MNEIIKESIPAKMRAGKGHPSKQTFQAIRIECNRELDVLKEALFNLDRAGYDVRATVHDEVIITARQDQTLEEAIALMCKGAPWMEGLPLNADGYYCSSYRKD